MECLEDISVSHSIPYESGLGRKWAKTISVLKKWRSGWQDTDASPLVLFYALSKQPDKVEFWREKVVDEIRGWAGHRQGGVNQSNFWKSYQSFDKNVAALLSAPKEWLGDVDLSHFKIGELDLSSRVPTLEQDNGLDFIVVDGLQRLQISPSTKSYHFQLKKSVKVLSLRAIRAITKNVADEIETIDAATVVCLLKAAKEVLSRGIDQRIRWRIVVETTACLLSAPVMTREHVLGFQLRTGNPPPFDPVKRRTGAVGLPVISSQEPKVTREQIFGRNNRRDFQMAVRARRGSTSQYFNTQTHTSVARSNRPAGRRRLWSDLQLAQYAGASRYLGRRGMVSHFRLVAGARGLPHSVGAEMKFEKGVR